MPYGGAKSDTSGAGLGGGPAIVEGSALRGPRPQTTELRQQDRPDPWVGTAADIFVQAQFPLHSGRIVGLFGRILISIMGLVVAALSVTGVVIWWRKRRARVRVRETAAVRLDRQLTPAE